MDELIKQLLEIQSQAPKDKLPGARNIYLAQGWFSDVQIDVLKKSFKALSENPTIGYIHLPLLHQSGGNVYDENGDFNPDFKWGVNTYNADETAIRNTDLTIAVLECGNEDSGTAYELGYAKASGKATVAYYVGDWDEQPINLMTAFGPDSYVNSLDELQTFDFRSIETRDYKGKIV